MNKKIIVEYASLALHAYIKMKNEDKQMCTVEEFDAWISGYMSGLGGSFPARSIEEAEVRKNELDMVYSMIMESELVTQLGFNSGIIKKEVSVSKI